MPIRASRLVLDCSAWNLPSSLEANAARLRGCCWKSGRSLPTDVGKSSESHAKRRIRAPALRSQARNSRTVALGEEARATKTRSTAGSAANSCRTASRNRRLTRLRITAPPTLVETVNPTRAAPSRGRKLAASGPSAKLEPEAFTARNSERRNSLDSLGNPSGPRTTTSARREPPAACGPWRDGASGSCDLQGWRCACGTRVPCCGGLCSADTCASRKLPPIAKKRGNQARTFGQVKKLRNRPRSRRTFVHQVCGPKGELIASIQPLRR
jgi:hypothetical protein